MSEISTWAGRIASLCSLVDDELMERHFPNPSALFRALADEADHLKIRAKVIEVMLPEAIKVSQAACVNGKNFYLGYTDLPGFTYGDFRLWLPYTNYCLVPMQRDKVPGLKEYLERFTGVHLVDMASGLASRNYDHGTSEEYTASEACHPANYRLINDRFGWSRGTFVVLQDFDYQHQIQQLHQDTIHYYRLVDPSLVLTFSLLDNILQALAPDLRTGLPEDPAEYNGFKKLLGDQYEEGRIVDVTHQSGRQYNYWGENLQERHLRFGRLAPDELVQATDVWMTVDEEIPF